MLWLTRSTTRRSTGPDLVAGLLDALTDVIAAGRLRAVSAEAAELTKLAETTYRDVNIALANEFAKHADQLHVDIHRVIDAANSQPFSHIHRPGVAVGGHSSPCTRGSISRVMRTRSYLAWRAISMRQCRAMP
jgi:hypothetical protein